MRINRISDEIILRMLLPNTYKYLLICSEEKVKEEYTSNDIEEFLKYKGYNNIVKYFINKFSQNFTEEQIKAMLYRLKGLTISELIYKSYSPFYISLGYYDGHNNEIVIEYYKDRRQSQEKLKETLIHELLHMASTRSVRDGSITGFDIPLYLGNAINEGYTEYLTKKYFTKGSRYVNSREVDVFFAKGIENLVGDSKMQELYFNANLNGLVNEIAKYSSKEDAIKLLFLMDRKNIGLRGEKDLIQIIEEIAKLNAKKLERELSLGNITYEEYQIQYAIKYTEYLKGNMWSESTKIVKDDDCFILKDQGFTSSVYEIKKATKSKEKNYY